MWENITGTADDKGNPNSDKVNLNGAVIADIGCGPGRFIDVARAKGARVIGIDYSAAMEVAEQKFEHNPDVCICQADALILPLKPQTLDGAFSIGVLHHTPNPQRGVEQAFRAPDFRWSLLDTFESVTPSY